MVPGRRQFLSQLLAARLALAVAPRQPARDRTRLFFWAPPEDRRRNEPARDRRRPSSLEIEPTSSTAATGWPGRW